MLFLTALRQSRQIWGVVLLGLLLALLPLRGWAEAAMHLAEPAPQLTASVASVPPCHATMAEHDVAMLDESASGCGLCSLCHFAALHQSEHGIEHEADATTCPASMPQDHGTPALPLPERPPRA